MFDLENLLRFSIFSMCTTSRIVSIFIISLLFIQVFRLTSHIESCHPLKWLTALFFFGRKSFFWPIMNILIVLPILGSKYCCITLLRLTMCWGINVPFIELLLALSYKQLAFTFTRKDHACSIFNSCYYNILHCLLWGSWVWTWWHLKQSIKMSRRLRNWTSV